jgi:tetratricopeptide (TPR) repeat protein
MLTRFLLCLLLASHWLYSQDDPQENFKFAKFNYDKENYEEALKFLDIALEVDDQYINAYYLRAETYYELGQYYNAILDINRIFKIDNSENISTTDYFLSRGKSFLALDDYSNANADLKKSLSSNPHNAHTHYYLAKLRLKTRNFEEALKHADTATMMNPNQAEFHAIKAEIKISKFEPVIGSKEYQEVLTELNKAIALDDQNPQYHELRGRFLKDMGEVDKAMEDFDAMIRLSPREENAYTSRGLIKMNRYDYRSAALDFTKSILLDPNIESNYRYRGLCYNNLNNLGEAYKDFSKAIELLSVKLEDAAEEKEVKNLLAETYILRGHCLNLMGKDPMACRDFLRAHNLGAKKGLNYYRKYCGIY